MSVLVTSLLECDLYLSYLYMGSSTEVVTRAGEICDNVTDEKARLIWKLTHLTSYTSYILHI